jgi:hypothetical protein
MLDYEDFPSWYVPSWYKGTLFDPVYRHNNAVIGFVFFSFLGIYVWAFVFGLAAGLSCGSFFHKGLSKLKD